MRKYKKEMSEAMKEGRKRKRGKPETEVDPSATETAEVAPEEPAAVAKDKEAAAPVVDDRLLRLQADFDNFRKRTLREREDIYQRANTDLMDELLPVLDHMELALKAACGKGGDASFVDGVRLVYDQMQGVLAKFGLVPIDAEGQVFDPALHEAVSHLPSPDVPENHVMVQSRRGYKMGERVLRAAQVVVSSGAPPEDHEC